MRYTISLIIKKITAWFMSIFMSLGIGGGQVADDVASYAE